MKKILLILCVFIAFGATAQQKQGNIVSNDLTFTKGIIHTPNSQLRDFKAENKKVRGGTQYYRWLDFMAAEDVISQAQLDAATFVFYMFPDSVVRFPSPNTNFGISYASIGQVFDGLSPIINNNLTPGVDWVLGSADAYTVDSVFIAGSYNKLSSAVDTLIVSVLHSGGANHPVSFFTGQIADFGFDTTRFMRMGYPETQYLNGAVQEAAVGGPAGTVVKYILTNADSSDYTPGANSFGLKSIGVPINLSVPPGERVSVSVTFKPSTPYTAGDSITKNNFFMFRSTEPNGDNTFMPFYANDFNMSSIVSKDTSNGWAGDYIPTVAFTQPYSPEVHDIAWRITCATCTTLGTKDFSKLEGVKVYPNPATEVLNISLDQELMGQTVNVTVADLLGKNLLNNSFKAQNANNEFALNGLAKGIYIYTITSEGKATAGKLVVQ